MAASDRVSPGFWVVCAEPEGFGGPLAVGLPGLGRAVAVFSFEEEALLYLRLREGGGVLRARRVAGGLLLALLSGRWSGFRSVALDPMPALDTGTLPPLTTTSRERFVHFLQYVEERKALAAVPAAL